MEKEKKDLKKILGIITFAIVLYWVLQNISLLIYMMQFVIGVLFPFLLGGSIAFILNVPMQAIERTLFRPSANGQYKMKKGSRRVLSMLIAIFLVLAVIFIVVFLVAPEMARSAGILKNNVPIFFNNVQIWANDFLKQYPELLDWVMTIKFDWQKIMSTMFGFLQVGADHLFTSTFTVAASVFSGVVTFFLGLIFAIYILMQKEKLSKQARQILYAFLPETKADKIVSIGKLSLKTFSNFLSGQCVEAVILGVLFFVFMSLFGFPYALMISVLIAFTALIPIFGAFIGCAVGVFLILMINPPKALLFLILFLILQQVEGNLIYPRVVGNSVGLPSIWVLLAVTLGASTMGIVGMLINIPLFSVLYTLLREIVYKRLEKRNIAKEKLE